MLEAGAIVIMAGIVVGWLVYVGMKLYQMGYQQGREDYRRLIGFE